MPRGFLVPTVGRWREVVYACPDLSDQSKLALLRMTEKQDRSTLVSKAHKYWDSLLQETVLSLAVARGFVRVVVERGGLFGGSQRWIVLMLPLTRAQQMRLRRIKYARHSTVKRMIELKHGED